VGIHAALECLCIDRSIEEARGDAKCHKNGTPGGLKPQRVTADRLANHLLISGYSHSQCDASGANKATFVLL
jgi:hypothetical protein